MGLWTLADLSIYLAALVTLTAGGNLFSRGLLQFSGISLPQNNQPPTPVPQPQATPAQNASGQAATAVPSIAAQPATNARAGRMIGSLERLIILIGLVAGSWEIMAAVIALKTVGRFKELDERLHAEYFLIGSLASVVWAAAISLGLIWFDQHLGLNLSGLLQPLNKS